MIAIGCDRGGFALKQEVMRHLDELGLAYKDFGTYSEESCDYPIYGEAVARAVAAGECERGILICGTGIGISISANKVKGIRAALCGDCYSAEMTRRHTMRTSSPWARACAARASRSRSWTRSSTPSLRAAATRAASPSSATLKTAADAA